MNLGGTIRINRIGFCIICVFVILIIIYLSPSRNSDHQVVNLKVLLGRAIEAAERGGKEILHVYGNGTRNVKDVEIKGKTKEGAIVPVTDADYKSHCVMYNGLTSLYPSIKIISEEKKENCGNVSPLDIEKPMPYLAKLPDQNVDSAKLTIWIDPLDATKEFTENLLNFVTTMVCVAYEGRPIIGVIHKPFGVEPKTHWAWLNKGHSFPYEKMKELNGPNIVIISKSHAGDIEKSIKSIFGEDATTRPAGGSGYKSEELVAGNVSVYIHKTAISKWDTCAGDAIISAMGGRFTDLNGEELDYSSFAEHLSEKGVLAASVAKHVKFVEKTKNIFFQD